MVVGVCRVVLSLPFNDSLKGKRAVVKSIVERARVKFRVAAAEVDDMDAHKRAVLGFSAVSNDARHVQSMLDTLVAFVAGASEAQVLDKRITVEHYDGALTASRSEGDNLGDDEDELLAWDEEEDDGDDEK